VGRVILAAFGVVDKSPDQFTIRGGKWSQVFIRVVMIIVRRKSGFLDAHLASK
jgi:hypothetical protein